MLLAALLVATPAEAIDVAVSTGPTTLHFDVTPGERVDEVWEGVLTVGAKPRKQEDLHVVIDVVEEGDQYTVTVLLEGIRGKRVRRIANPTLLTKKKQVTEFFTGGVMPVQVRRTNGEDEERPVYFGTRVVVGKSFDSESWTAVVD